MSDDITKLATVLYEVVEEIGARHLLPHDFVAEWLHKLRPMCSKYDCHGCGEPIRFDEGMIGSDVFSIYCHAGCEAVTKENWKASNPAPVELEPKNLGGSDG